MKDVGKAYGAYDAARWSHRALGAVSKAAHGGDRRDALLAWLAARVLPKPQGFDM